MLTREQIVLKTAIIDGVLSVGLLYGLSLILTNILRYFQPGIQNAHYILIWSLIFSLIWLFSVQGVLSSIQVFDAQYLSFYESTYWVKFGLAFLILVLAALLMWLKQIFENQRKEDERELQMLKIAKDAELNSLRLQLQPHFLFNSLNSISSLAGSNPDKAREMIQQLSDFLRGTIKTEASGNIMLSEELEHIRLYLEIEKVRFGHRLKTTIDFDEKCLENSLPPLVLQPVIENAIKYGLYGTLGEVEILIKINCSNDELLIEISNPYDDSLNPGSKGVGFGLSGLKRRLYLIYSRNDLVKTSQSEGKYITLITIPK
ncbi:MAG TPA: histidine kinase [Bacteroidia bacterium]